MALIQSRVHDKVGTKPSGPAGSVTGEEMYIQKNRTMRDFFGA